MTDVFPDGTVHAAADDLRAALLADAATFGRWQGLTPLGRNEFICWVEEAKRPATRQRRIAQTCEQVQGGKTRPCCWPGCSHRTDKPPARWRQAALLDGKRGS